MTDEERIDLVLKIVKFYWSQHPDQRLMQLISNALKLQHPDRSDHFYTTDGDLINALCDMTTNLEKLDKE